MKNELRYFNVKKGHFEHDYMWNRLAEHPLNKEEDTPQMCGNKGELWQYMGTHFKKRWQHEFRHRYHPKTFKKEWIVVTPSKKFLSIILNITRGPKENLPLYLGLGFDECLSELFL